jgi:hypothetical protein
MKKVVCLSVGVVCLVLATTFSTQAQIAKWTFETSQPLAAPGAGNWLTNISAEIGTGTASALHAGASVYTTPAGNGSAHSISATNWAVGDLYQFEASTIGFSAIQLEWDQTSSGTGPRDFNLFYSTDGTSFTQFGSTYTVQVNGSPNVAWNATTASSVFHYLVDLSSVSQLDNASTAYFRLVDASTVSANGGVVATAGTDRVDNFTIEIVPEPQSISLVLLGGVGILATRFARRRK